MSSRGSLGVRGSNVNMNDLEHFERRRDVCGGEWVVKGTRVTVRIPPGGTSLSEGARQGEILADFPTVSLETLRAVIAFAAAPAGEVTPAPPVPVTA